MTTLSGHPHLRDRLTIPSRRGHYNSYVSVGRWVFMLCSFLMFLVVCLWNEDFNNDPQKHPALPKRRGKFNISQSAATIMVQIYFGSGQSGTTTLNGKLPFRRLGHCPVTLGENTAPTWHLLLKFLVLRQGNSGSKIRSSSLAWLNICSGPGCAIEEEIGAKSIGWFRFGPYHHWISTGTFWTPQLMPTFPLRNRSDNRKSNSMYIYIYLYK